MTALAPERFAAGEEEGQRLLEWADTSRLAILHSIGDDGIARPVVNPLKSDSRQPLETGSPEGQLFVVLMIQAHADYIASKASSS